LALRPKSLLTSLIALPLAHDTTEGVRPAIAMAAIARPLRVMDRVRDRDSS